jgi:hypothetical protein
MLQRVQTEISEVGGLGMAVDSDYAALVMEFVGHVENLNLYGEKIFESVLPDFVKLLNRTIDPRHGIVFNP